MTYRRRNDYLTATAHAATEAEAPAIAIKTTSLAAAVYFRRPVLTSCAGLI